jgi:hypothetical protein
MSRRLLTPAEQRAYRELARAAAKLRRAQHAAEQKRQRDGAARKARSNAKGGAGDAS